MLRETVFCGSVGTMQRSSIRGVVRGGRIRVDAPTDLPEGVEVELVPIDAAFDESTDQRRLDASIEAGIADAAAGRTRPVSEFLSRRVRRP